MRTELTTGFLKNLHRKKRGKTNGKEKLSKIAALSLAAAMVLTTKFFL